MAGGNQDKSILGAEWASVSNTADKSSKMELKMPTSLCYTDVVGSLSKNTLIDIISLIYRI